MKRDVVAVLGLVVVLALLSSSAVLQATNVLPNTVGATINNGIAKGIAFLRGQSASGPQGGVYGVAFVRSVDGKWSNSTGSPTSYSVLQVGSSAIYDTSSGRSGLIGDQVYLTVSIINGTATKWSVSGNLSQYLDGKQLNTVAVAPSGSGAPQSVFSVGSISRMGTTIYTTDFASAPAGTSHTYTYGISGAICVTFAQNATQPVCHSFGATGMNPQALTLVNPGSGSFSVSVSATTTVSTVSTTTGPQLYYCVPTASFVSSPSQCSGLVLSSTFTFFPGASPR